MALTKVTSGMRTLATDEVLTANINDDAVTTAKVPDNAVTLAKLADGTQGGTLYYGASGAPTQLAAGTSGHFLKTLGTGANPAWAAVATSSNTPAFNAKRSSSQTIATSTNTIMNWDSEQLDTDGDFDTTTNVGRFTPTTAGWYFMYCTFQVYPLQSQPKAWVAAIRQNGSDKQQLYNVTATTYGEYTGGTVAVILEANGSSDYYDVVISQNSGSDKTVAGNFGGFLLAGA